MQTDLSALGGIPFLDGLGEEERRDCVDAASPLSAVRDDAIFTQGHRNPTTVYLLLEGCLRISRTTSDGQLVAIDMIEPGRVFGCEAVLRHPERIVSITARKASRLLRWDMAQLEQVFERHPRVMRNYLDIAVQCMIHFAELMTDLATKTVSQRLARALLRLSTQFGAPYADGTLIDCRLTRQDLGEMTSATGHIISRLLSSWEREGLLHTLEGKRLLIHDLSRLQRLAEHGGGLTR